MQDKRAVELDPTGVPGLDDVLKGGFPRGHLYLIEGASGAGKTTLGLQFLLEGARLGQKVLWCTLAETESQLHATAAAHGWDLSGVTIVNLAEPGDAGGLLDAQYSFFSPGDVELNDVTRAIVEIVDRVQPRRVVFDPFSDVRLLARDPLRYRRQLLQLREHFARVRATVLLIQESGLEGPSDPTGEGVVHGIVALDQNAPAYGRPRRRLRVLKLRGLDYREGFHDIVIRTGGLEVFPKLVAGEHALPWARELASSGVAELDLMLGGGLDHGSSLMLTGPSGAGKSTICTQYALAMAARRERAAVFLFDETRRAFLARAQGLDMPVDAALEDGRLAVHQVDPAAFSPGEFAHVVRREVEEHGARLVALDSLNGYLSAMPDERHLALHVHELLTYLSLRNVVTLVTINQHGVLGETMSNSIDVSYLADASILIRYFEAHGAVRRAVSVVKRRCGPHEVSIREMTICAPGIQLGEALTQFRGVLTGQPDFLGSSEALATR